MQVGEQLPTIVDTSQVIARRLPVLSIAEDSILIASCLDRDC